MAVMFIFMIGLKVKSEWWVTSGKCALGLHQRLFAHSLLQDADCCLAVNTRLSPKFCIAQELLMTWIKDLRPIKKFGFWNISTIFTFITHETSNLTSQMKYCRSKAESEMITVMLPQSFFFDNSAWRWLELAVQQLTHFLLACSLLWFKSQIMFSRY